MSENQKEWEYLIEFYEDWIKDGYDLTPMLNLVKWLSTSKFKDEIYPNQSHTALNISAVKGYHEQLKFPSISINYSGQMFHVAYSPNSNQTHNLEKLKCHQTQIFSLLESLFVRLEAETKIKQ
ncbi:MAG TPA: hypothetical protein VIL74_04335 [Pyrinomonadaceae bacterium]|jgi:hypothetical protein